MYFRPDLFITQEKFSHTITEIILWSIPYKILAPIWKVMRSVLTVYIFTFIFSSKFSQKQLINLCSQTPIAVITQSSKISVFLQINTIRFLTAKVPRFDINLYSLFVSLFLLGDKIPSPKLIYKWKGLFGLQFTVTSRNYLVKFHPQPRTLSSHMPPTVKNKERKKMQLWLCFLSGLSNAVHDPITSGILTGDWVSHVN